MNHSNPGSNKNPIQNVYWLDCLSRPVYANYAIEDGATSSQNENRIGSLQKNLLHNKKLAKKMNVNKTSKFKNFKLKELINIVVNSSGYSESVKNLSEKYNYSPERIKENVHSFSNIFKLINGVVYLKPEIPICYRHLNSNGCTRLNNCTALHICKKFIEGTCNVNDCAFGHMWDTNHNKAILQDNHLGTLCTKQLCDVFKIGISVNNIPDLKICIKYNENKCSVPKCLSLHICIRYLAQSCVNLNCQYNHNFKGKQLCSILKKISVSLNETPKDIIFDLNSFPTINKQIKDFMGISKPFKPEMGSNSAEKFCAINWQFKFAKKSWKNLSNELLMVLETAYADPSVDAFKLPTQLSLSLTSQLGISKDEPQWEVDFENMSIQTIDKVQTIELRRLSTEDILRNSNETSKSCTFCWYFIDIDNKWIEYGKEDSTKKHKCNVNSADIENHFKEDPNTSLSFKSERFCYELNFNTMYQQNLETKVKRKVKRRPMAHWHEKYVQSSKICKINDLPEKVPHGLPNTWEPMKVDERVRRVTLDVDSDEFKEIFTFITLNIQDNSKYNILKIERIQNPSHYRIFQEKVKEMTTIYKNQTIVNVQQLFHGTRGNVVQDICEQNLDWRLHGTNVGQLYGRGAYFSPSLSIPMCLNYAKPDESGNCYVFIAKVAVGTITTKCNTNTALPPTNSEYNIPFDSTANKLPKPEIIVKYDKAEYFMEYILTVSRYS